MYTFSKLLSGLACILIGCGSIDQVEPSIPGTISQSIREETGIWIKIAPNVSRRINGDGDINIFAHGSQGAKWLLSEGNKFLSPQDRHTAEQFLDSVDSKLEDSPEHTLGNLPEAERYVIPSISNSCVGGVLSVTAQGSWDNSPDFPLTGTANVVIDGAPVFNFGSGVISSVLATSSSKPACGSIANASGQVTISGTGNRSTGVVDYVFAFTNRTGITCGGFCQITRPDCLRSSQSGRSVICR